MRQVLEYLKRVRSPEAPAEDAASVEAAWDSEIATRVNEVEEGKVELIPGDEADRRTDALFAELGVIRPPA